MEKPKPVLKRVIEGEQAVKCGVCGSDFIVRPTDPIGLLGYKGFGLIRNPAVWATPCKECGKEARFEANDSRNLNIECFIGCGKCMLLNEAAHNEEELKAMKKSGIASFDCKGCGHRNEVKSLPAGR